MLRIGSGFKPCGRGCKPRPAFAFYVWDVAPRWAFKKKKVIPKKQKGRKFISAFS
jgi:hypothetical protein